MKHRRGHGHPCQAGRGTEFASFGRRGSPAPATSPRGSAPGQSGRTKQNTRVPLSRIAWLVTVIGFVIAALLVLAEGYIGYFGVLLAVAASAAVNLR